MAVQDLNQNQNINGMVKNVNIAAHRVDGFLQIDHGIEQYITLVNMDGKEMT
jgi:hypothetical protein